MQVESEYQVQNLSPVERRELDTARTIGGAGGP